MSTLVHQRCLNHASREAVVRCPDCRRFFCRECVIEHAGRMICSDCLTAIAAPREINRARTAFWSAGAAGGFLVAWAIFYYAGMMLARVPSDFFK
jgi:hypothetical protein